MDEIYMFRIYFEKEFQKVCESIKSKNVDLSKIKIVGGDKKNDDGSGKKHVSDEDESIE